MLFKSPEIGLQMAHLHPKVRAALTSIDAQVQLWRLPQITITDLSRSYEENCALYTAIYEKDGCAPDEAASRAKEKRSYHLVDCAADFRGSGKEPYSKAEDARIQAWMHEQFPQAQWEVLTHNLGFGLHHHLAFKDHERLRQWQLSLKV